MSESPDQLAGAEAPVAEAPAGVAAAAPATTTTDDIETEAFDRMEAPDEPDAEAGDGQSADGETTPDPAGDPDLIDVEAAGQTFKVPAALKPFLLMQEDYTKKTQAVAERGREVETKAQELAAREAQQAESLKTFRTEHAEIANREIELGNIAEQLGAYSKLTMKDWADLKAADPAQYTAHSENYDLLKRARDTTQEGLAAAQEVLKAKEAKLTEDQTAAHAAKLKEAWNETNATLAQKIPDWSKRNQEIATFMHKELGVSAEELREAVDPRVWIVSDRAMRAEARAERAEAALKQSTATETALKSQTAQPATKPAGGGAQPRGVTDNLSPEEWLRRRNAQIARKAAAR